MAEGEVVVKRSARVLVVDDGRLVLIKRIKPGHAVYYVTPGGTVEDGDDSAEAALHREVREELGGAIPSPSGPELAEFVVRNCAAVAAEARRGRMTR
ncbi:NUDIX domain-containing protein [Spirillospora sp. NPDC052269]